MTLGGADPAPSRSPADGVHAPEPPVTVRPATPDDLDGIASLCGRMFRPREADNVRSVFDPGCPRLRLATVAVADGTVVSTSLLLAHRLRIGRVEAPAGQIEWVATDPRYRRRGLVRRQFALLEQEAAGGGALALFIDGVPNFYRRLGYHYGLDWPPVWALRNPVPPRPDDLEVRLAEPGDAGAVLALDRQAQAAADVVSVRDEADWAWIVGVDTGDQWTHVAERRNEVVAVLRSALDGRRLWLQDLAGVDEDAALAVVGAAIGTAAAAEIPEGSGDADAPRPAPLDVRLIGRGDPLVAAVGDRLGVRADETHGLYVRLPDPLALLRALRPELSARLRRAGWRDRDGEVVLWTYERGFRIAVTAGEVTAVGAFSPVDGGADPLDDGAVGVPEDRLPELLLGRRDPRALETLVDDVVLGPRAALVDALFPRLRGDPLPLAT